MNISPINMIQKAQSFGCAKCDQEAEQNLPKTTQDTQDAPVAYVNMGPNYFFPVSAAQVKAYENKQKAYLEEYDRVNQLDANQEEPLEEYLERHKLEWSM